MVLLTRDVFTNPLDIGLADRECAVSCLPIEICIGCPLSLHPFGSRFLGLFYHFGNCDGAREVTQDMNVILDSIDQNRFTSDVLKYACQIGVEADTEFRIL